MLNTLFFICLYCIVHTYFLYPLVMLLLGKLFGGKSKTSDAKYEPTVEIIFAAHNEERVLVEKLKRSLDTQYNGEKLSIRIGSDCSTDRTNEIIEDFAKKYPNIHFTLYTERQGKASIINQLVQQSKADLIICTDANILFTPQTIPHLVAPMADKYVGINGGKIGYPTVNKQGISLQESVYLKIENNIKQAESDLFAKAMGVEGGCYIIRRKLFPEIPPLFFMEDFFVSLSLMKDHFKVLFTAKAECFEDVSVQSTEEYKRKVRISIGNFQNLAYFRKYLFTRFIGMGFLFLSHKVLRWLTPFFLLLLLPLSTILAQYGIGYALFAGVYMLFISLGMFGILFSQNKRAGLLKYPGHFLHMNLALLEGFTMFLKGVTSNAWEPTKRHQ